MTETLSSPPPLPVAPTRLVRARPRKVAGVCEGLGRYTGTDPLLWRVSAVLLVLFGAVGVVLYVVAWVLLPEEGGPPSPGERLAGAVSLAWPFPLLAAVAGGVVLLFATDHPRVLVPAAVLAGLGYLVATRRGTRPAPTPPLTEPAVDWSAPSVGPSWPPPPLVTDWPEPYGPPPTLPVVAAPAPRRRSRLGPLVLSATALVAGALLGLRRLGVDGVTVDRVLAVALLCLGAGLVLGAVWGRARWLFLVGLLMTAGLVPAQLVDGGPLRGGVGERTWVATGSGDYRLGVGEALLDLRGLPEAPGTVVSAEVGLGELVVLVPDDLTVRVRAHATAGEVSLPVGDDRNSNGTDVDRSELLGPPGPVDLVLDVRVGVGNLEVRHG